MKDLDQRMSPFQSIYETFIKKENLRVVLMILIIKVSGASVRQVSHLYNNPEIILDLKTLKLVLMVI